MSEAPFDIVLAGDAMLAPSRSGAEDGAPSACPHPGAARR